MSGIDHTREHLIETYRKKAKHYDITSRFYPVPGYPQRAHRLRAVQALRLRRGDCVIDIACGTGLNFPLIEEAIGPDGWIVGVDLTDAMLARAEDRIAAHGWKNVSLVQAEAAEFDFPAGIDGILSTYALSQVPECEEVIVHGATALSGGRRWVVLDLKVPDDTPRWLVQLGTAVVRPYASADEWIARRRWDAIRTAMRDTLADVSWTELCFGTTFLAAGSHGPIDPVDGSVPGSAAASAASADDRVAALGAERGRCAHFDEAGSGSICLSALAPVQLRQPRGGRASPALAGSSAVGGRGRSR